MNNWGDTNTKYWRNNAGKSPNITVGEKIQNTTRNILNITRKMPDITRKILKITIQIISVKNSTVKKKPSKY